MASLTLTHSTCAGRAAALLAAVYGQYVPDLTITHRHHDKLEFKSASSQTYTQLVEIAKALLEAAGKTNEALGGASDQVQQSVLHYLDLVDENKFDGEKGAEAADAELTTRTFLVGESVSAADLGLFAAVHPTVASATHNQHLSHPSLSRHFNHIQNLRLVAPHLSTVFTSSSPEPVKIDVENVPVVEIKQQAKVKKTPAAAAAAAAAAAEAPQEAGKQEKADKAQVVEEVKKKVETVAPIAVAEGTTSSAAKPKKEKVEKVKKPTPAVPVTEAPAPWMIDLRVGKIVEVAVHPDADSLYVEKIDVGEEEPRTVVSGLVKYMTLEQSECTEEWRVVDDVADFRMDCGITVRGATLITVCNLKPANMRGVKSFAMVLCVRTSPHILDRQKLESKLDPITFLSQATATEGKEAGIEFLSPPEGSVPGDRVYFEGFEDQQALEILNPKKKIFETVQPGFTTLENREGAWVDKESGKAYKIVTKRGECRTRSLVGASLS
ncbi:BZ3500_MvSof-1268-A1-R1_Chr11-1g03144 [Microbotryum saponariae]|uniref:BZ3500_MvSof-1268-A1-R1_Chr11-1g03144 protein n=1 Tax=Microbotryum saponariae TaxID=289078 RepID=A0A2X0LA26_9BASI|nr:BZ3501_MvSof-1269-A2-R1_Chr11g02719 [Microbotryum saponariae]SDA03704.1 BZ3500_MvSof-1268-A1-R1_Chr11-1g03144 [Microbotryum saponariae]